MAYRSVQQRYCQNAACRSSRGVGVMVVAYTPHPRDVDPGDMIPVECPRCGSELGERPARAEEVTHG